ncbi:hypothetical protein [Nannocystis pusilla]|uniref:hypothetical protein n=1 Tax=Nannocystis pusilla TaxID=889268 RepID=UPI003DA60484
MREAHGYFCRAVRMHSNLAMRSGLGSLEDAAQELTLVFAQRLTGEHPFDPTLASLSHYCTIMTRSVLINRLNKRWRHAVGHHGIMTEFGDREARLDEDVISEVLDPELGAEWMAVLDG